MKNKKKNDIWSKIEDYKDEDGEYDLTSVDQRLLNKMFRSLNSEDYYVRIVKK